MASWLLSCVTLVCVLSLTSGHLGAQIRTKQHWKYDLKTSPTRLDRVGLPPERWFVQKLDHFNDADTRTWSQVKKRFGVVVISY